ncbi:MAG: arginine--tRNA ligase [Acholeplasmataceae bacterium]|nr:arginine--tRNA ligase [Acholeplasmataceae bacterium]
MFQQLRLDILKRLEKYDYIIVEEPKRADSDLAIPLFNVSKKEQIPINEVSKEITSLLEDHPLISKLEFDRGFLNIYFNRELFSKEVLSNIKDEKYGTLNSNGKVVCIDYSSPNIAKSFSVGHLRSTVIGASLYKVYEKLGYKVIGINHLGDWGTQFGKMIVAYDLWGSEEELKKNPIDYLQSLYVKFHEEENELLEEKARETFKALEDGDKRVLALWEYFKEESLKEFMKMYEILNVKFDSYHGEAFYNDKMADVVKILTEKELTEIDDGALIVRLNDDLPPALIKRSDGATLYITRDLAALLYRYNTYHFDKVLYVVGNEQKLHFNQLKKVSDLMGYNFDITHVNFGLVLIDGKKMSTREGKVVKLYDVISEAVNLALKAITEKNPNLKDKEEAARKIGVSAVIFNDLKNDRKLDIDFNLEEMLSFEGLTGPYLQYSSVRIYSMLKDETIKEGLVDPTLFKDDLYYKLVILLSQFSNTLERVILENGPHILSRYLLNLAATFNQFYGAHKVIVEDEKVKNTNLILIKAVRVVLNEGMRLLGMAHLDEM